MITSINERRYTQDLHRKIEILDAYKSRVINLLSDLLRQEKVIVHHIGGRTKDYESLSKKIDRKLSKYNSLDEITDLVGIRIISYLESDVDHIANMIKREFVIDEANSVDKRELSINEFGYKSLHLVFSISTKRGELTGYRGYETIKCEIQIRSILQHAWAEIEHDLGYKGKASIPNQYKRNFNRLAALLETADIEFDRLKRELASYENKVGELIRKNPETVQIDQASLSEFNIENSVLKQAREIMAKIKGWSYTTSEFDFYGLIERFELFGMKTIKDIDDSLNMDKELFFEFIKEFIKDFDYEEMSVTVGVYYYQHFLAAKSENPDKVLQYFLYPPYTINLDNGAADKLIELYKKMKLSK